MGALEWTGELTGAARATIVGKNRALIENHLGIIELTATRLRLAARGGEIVIDGEQIEIEQARPKSLIVRGAISALTLPRAND